MRFKNWMELLCCVVIIGCANFVCASEDKATSFELELKSLTLSEPVAIGANFDDWETDAFQPGERLYTKQSLHTGVKYKNMALGYTYQLFYFMNFSEDTSRWYYYDKNDQLDEKKEIFDVFLDVNHAQGSGFYFSYDWKPVKWLDVKARINYLALNKLTYGVAEGVYDPNKEVFDSQTDLTIDYAYSEEKILGRDDFDKPEGDGVTLDLAMDLKWRNHKIHWRADALYSRLQWRKVPASKIRGNLDSIASRKDAALRFYEFYSDITQKMPTHSVLRYEYTFFEPFSVSVEHETLDTKAWNKLGFGWSLSDSLHLAARKSLGESVWGFTVASKYFWLDWEADDVKFDAASTFKVSMSARMAF